MSAEETRGRILEAAADLISKEGIDEVRIARVANRARVSTSLIHHYFSTREELLTDALMLAFDQAAEERFGTEEPEIAKRSHTDALAVAIEQCLPGPGRTSTASSSASRPGDAEREWVLWVELWLRAARDPELRPVAARLYERYREWMEELIAAGIEAGEFRDTDPGRVADLALGLFDGLGLRALLEDPGVDLERARTLIAGTLATELGIEASALSVDMSAAQR
jgi:AcrR family transcriptional regulator